MDVIGHTIRIVVLQGTFDFLGIILELNEKVLLGFACQQVGFVVQREELLSVFENTAETCVSILGIVDWILASEFLCQINIEIKMGVDRAGNKEITSGIDTDFFNELFPGNGISSTFAPLELLAVFEQTDHLDEKNLQVVRIVS